MANDKKDLWEQCADLGCVLHVSRDGKGELVYQARYDHYYDTFLTTGDYSTPEQAIAEARQTIAKNKIKHMKIAIESAIRYTEDLLAESETKTLILRVLYDRLRDTPRDGKNTA